MKSKSLIGYALCIILLLATVFPVVGQRSGPVKQRDEVPTEDEILKFMDYYKELEQVNSEALGPQLDDIVITLLFWGELAAKMNSDRIAQEILNFPIHDPLIAKAKIGALSYFGECPSGAHEFVFNSLYDPSSIVQAAATRALIKWGTDMNEVLPVIRQLGNYGALTHAPKTPEIESELREAVKTSTWEGRIRAAMVIELYSDTLTIIDVSKDVVRNSPVGIDDSSIARAKYLALGRLSLYRCEEMIQDIASLVNDKSTLVRIAVVDVLRSFASNGNQEAVAALELISNSNDDPKLRSTARLYLEQIIDN